MNLDLSIKNRLIEHQIPRPSGRGVFKEGDQGDVDEVFAICENIDAHHLKAIFLSSPHCTNSGLSHWKEWLQ